MVCRWTVEIHLSVAVLAVSDSTASLPRPWCPREGLFFAMAIGRLQLQIAQLQSKVARPDPGLDPDAVRMSMLIKAVSKHWTAHVPALLLALFSWRANAVVGNPLSVTAFPHHVSCLCPFVPFLSPLVKLFCLHVPRPLAPSHCPLVPGHRHLQSSFCSFYMLLGKKNSPT